MRFFHQNLLASAKTVCEFLFLLCEVLFSKAGLPKHAGGLENLVELASYNSWRLS